jgi:transcriptional regulator with XRE-family HTH domain
LADVVYTERLAWLMDHGPRGRMRQIDIVQRSQDLGDGLTKAEVNRIVNGATDPKLSTLEKVARALGVDLGELLPPRTLRKRLEIAEIGNDQVVIDTAMRRPANGDLVVIRHPVERTLRLMRVTLEGQHYKFTDDLGYVIGEVDLIVGEVVLSLRRPQPFRTASAKQPIGA